jgi:hypothetical protein
VLVKVGDRIEKEQPLLVLESDKATMEVPADAAGTITSIAVKVDDKVKKVHGEMVDLYYESITDMEQKGVLEKENRALEYIERGQCKFLKNYLGPGAKASMGGRRRYRTKKGTRKRK